MRSPALYDLPGEPSGTFPLMRDGEPLSLGLMEFGVREKRKRGQLRNKEILLLAHWEHHYFGNGVDWYPSVFRAVGDFTNAGKRPSSQKDSVVDLWIRCSYLPSEAQTFIGNGGKRCLTRGLEERLTAELPDEAQSLYEFASGPSFGSSLDKVRGNISEYFLQSYTIACCQDLGISAIPNFRIYFRNSKYRNGTELDMLLLFYGESPFHELKERLMAFPNLVVGSDR